MGIRQLPSGAFQVRFQHHGAPFAATYPTREHAEDAEPLLRAAALAGCGNTSAAHENETSPSNSPTPRPPPTPTPDEVRSSSAAAAASIEAILADVIPQQRDEPPAADEVLTTGQAATLLGVSRPTLVAWLEAGRIPLHRCGTHRRLQRSHVLAFREQIQQSSRR